MPKARSPGKYHDNLAHVTRDKDFASGDGHCAIGVGAGDDEEVIARRDKGTTVVFQRGPRSLIVIRRLRHDVRQQERGIVVSFSRGAIPGWAVVATVVAATAVIAIGHAIPTRWQGGVGVEGVAAGSRAKVLCSQMPRHPVRRRMALVVRKSVLRLLHQIVVHVRRVGGGT